MEFGAIGRLVFIQTTIILAENTLVSTENVGEFLSLPITLPIKWQTFVAIFTNEFGGIAIGHTAASLRFEGVRAKTFVFFIGDRWNAHVVTAILRITWMGFLFIARN